MGTYTSKKKKLQYPLDMKTFALKLILLPPKAHHYLRKMSQGSFPIHLHCDYGLVVMIIVQGYQRLTGFKGKNTESSKKRKNKIAQLDCRHVHKGTVATE